MNLNFSKDIRKEEVFYQVRQELAACSYKIINEEFRPWGGFFVIDEQETEKFLAKYFFSLKSDEISIENKLSPKILIVAAGKRLSWQYHFRRSEVWAVIGGKVGVAKSDTDQENDVNIYNIGAIIKLEQGERHRLVGLDNWGIVAEIWQHTNNAFPSNEDDIVRLSDDFGR